LSEDVEDSEIHIDGYDVYRTDRRERIHGGVAIFIAQQHLVKSVDNFGNDLAEGIKITMPIAHTEISIHCCYRSGYNSEESNHCLLSWLEKGMTPNSIIAGDFNLPKVDWEFDRLVTGANHTEKLFLDWTTGKDLK